MLRPKEDGGLTTWASHASLFKTVVDSLIPCNYCTCSAYQGQEAKW